MSEQPASQNDPEFAPQMPPRKVRWGRIGCVTMLVVVISAPFVFMFLFVASFVEGEEFSCDTFETRRFHYFSLPVIGTPLTKRTIEDSSSVLHKTLLGDGYVQPPATKTARWDLISENWQSGTSADFDAAILDKYLKMSADGHDSYWSNWNDRNPERAPVFWKVIAELARANQYVLMPDLFRMAMDFPEAKKGDPDSFWAELHKLASKLVAAQAERIRRSGDSSAATELDTLASSIANPDTIVAPVKPADKTSNDDSGESTDL